MGGQRKKNFFFTSFLLGEEKEYVLENLAILLGSGMDIIAAMEAIALQVKSRRLKSLLQKIKTEIENGASLWQAMKESHLFHSQAISLIQLGEATGQLTQNLKMIALQQRKDRFFHSRVSSAIMYPFFVFGLSIVIGGWVVFFILPPLSNSFAALHIELPLLTRILMGLGVYISLYGFIIAPIFILLLGFFFFLFFIWSKTKYLGEFFLFHFPGIGKLLREIELGRLGYLAGILLRAGVTPVEAFASLQEAATFRFYKKFYAFLKDQLDEGQSFKKSFAQFSNVKIYIPSPMQQLIVTAEQSGRLSEAFLDLGDFYEARVDVMAKNLTVILEPLLLIFVGLIVLIIALVVITPIYHLVGSLE
jgi:type IV pilus assembly protein PilC